MGKHITSKKHYQEEMARGGYMDFDKACALADKVSEKRDNPKFELSQKARDVIKAAENSKDKKGNVKLGDRTIEAMKEVGVCIQVPSWCPRSLLKDGGFKD